jgi:hypothetical protein
VSPIHTSVPREDRRAVAGGTGHVVVCSPGTAAGRVVAELGDEPFELLCLGPAPSELGAPEAVSSAATVDELERLLANRLASAVVGVRVHVAGSDAVVRRLGAVAWEAGLQADEIGLACDTEQAVFRVACVHCGEIAESVSDTVVECTGCERTLFVYHHFSRRKAAYMGFQADAELPGDIPPARSGLPCP